MAGSAAHNALDTLLQDMKIYQFNHASSLVSSLPSHTDKGRCISSVLSVMITNTMYKMS